MDDSRTRRFRAQLIEYYTLEDKPELRDFCIVLGRNLQRRIYPLGMRIKLPDPIKLRADTLVEMGLQERVAIPARRNTLDVVITHKYPMRPPLLQKVMVFGDRNLVDELNLKIGATVRLSIDRAHFDRAHVWDWARSIHTLLDSGIER